MRGKVGAAKLCSAVSSKALSAQSCQTGNGENGWDNDRAGVETIGWVMGSSGCGTSDGWLDAGDEYSIGVFLYLFQGGWHCFRKPGDWIEAEKID